MKYNNLDKKVDLIFNDIIQLRRHIHAHPELSGLEHQTAVLIAGYLRKLGWKVTESVGRTGVVAELGSTDNGFIGLRVDMDALPINENTNLPFSSKNDGIMHACGHDLHISIGLGVANLLKNLNLHYGTRLIFQPAEEIASGAKWMIDEGVTKGLKKILGVHVYPDLPVGKIGIKEGSLTAAAGELKLEVIGRSGHGARPHEGVDAIWAASKIISGIQESITRKLDPLDPVVITFGKIEGGKAFNVIAEKVNILGTVRCTSLNLFQNLECWLSSNISAIADSCGAKCKFEFRTIAPPVNNDLIINKAIRDSANELVGKQNIIELFKPSLGAEDFAEFLNYVPGAMFRLGVSSKEGCAPLHTSEFNPDEAAIKIAIKLITDTIVRLNKLEIDK